MSRQKQLANYFLTRGFETEFNLKLTVFKAQPTECWVTVMTTLPSLCLLIFERIPHHSEPTKRWEHTYMASLRW